MSAQIKKLTAANLAALLSARICHDLISPVGALTAALEVFDDDENIDMRDDAMELIKMSAGQASAKLQFLRIAFGAGGSAPDVFSLQKLKTLVDGVYGDGKTEIQWDISLDGVEKTMARLVLNMVMLAVQAVPRGGQVQVSISQAGTDTVLIITAEGMKAKLDENVVKTLAGGAPEDGFDGRSVQPFYTGMIARDAGGKASADRDGDKIVFTAKIPVSIPSE